MRKVAIHLRTIVYFITKNLKFSILPHVSPCDYVVKWFPSLLAPSDEWSSKCAQTHTGDIGWTNICICNEINAAVLFEKSISLNNTFMPLWWWEQTSLLVRQSFKTDFTVVHNWLWSISSQFGWGLWVLFCKWQIDLS